MDSVPSNQSCRRSRAQRNFANCHRFIPYTCSCYAEVQLPRPEACKASSEQRPSLHSRQRLHLRLSPMHRTTRFASNCHIFDYVLVLCNLQFVSILFTPTLCFSVNIGYAQCKWQAWPLNGDPKRRKPGVTTKRSSLPTSSCRTHFVFHKSSTSVHCF
jgi:hypothetical protein